MTYSGISELDECVASRFAAQRPRLVEQEVELGDGAELGEGLDERIPVEVKVNMRQ
jgi:hypothetical protein